MSQGIPGWVHATPEVVEALREGRPVVALESAVISHGLPPDMAVRLAPDLDAAVRRAGAVPAMVAVRRGAVVVGIDPGDMAFLLDPGVLKVAERDLAVAVARGLSGGTTVAGTLAVAHAAGIRVMATGGIGGVHQDAGVTGDVSADLAALSRRPLVVVCAGAKAFCDARRTLEALDSLGVAVVGYRTDAFPAFLARSTGLPVQFRADHAHEIAAIASVRTVMDACGALLVVQPPPADAALDEKDLEEAVASAAERARAAGVSGPALTPFLLGAMAEATAGRSLAANLAVLEANAGLAGEVAAALVSGGAVR
jgi:pseudouridine-5'-phosphate glycosidase